MAYKRICCPKCQTTFGQEKKFFEHLSLVHMVKDCLALYLEIYCSGIHPTCQCSDARTDTIMGLTQTQVAEEAGVVEIWGCGNYVVNYQ